MLIETLIMLSIIQDGVTGLMWASNNGHTEVVKFLLEAKANFNTTDNVRIHAWYHDTMPTNLLIISYRFAGPLSSVLQDMDILILSRCSWTAAQLWTTKTR